MHNATAITTGSANQRPNTPCFRLWIDVTFRGLENSYTVFIAFNVCVIIFMASPLWLSVGTRVFIRRIIYNFLNGWCLITQLLRLMGLDSVNRLNHTSWVAVVTLTECPKSVRNRCVIEVFGGGFVLSRCFLDFSVSVGSFVQDNNINKIWIDRPILWCL